MIHKMYNGQAHLEAAISPGKNPYDNILSSNVVIKGEVIHKDNRNIRVHVKDRENTILDIVTKNNISIKEGSMLAIKKSEVESIVKISDEKIKEEKEEEKKEIEEVKKIGVKPSKKNLDAYKNLKLYEIPATKENILKFATLKEELNRLKSIMDVTSITELMNNGQEGINDISIFDVNKLLKKSHNTTKELLSERKKISYDDARKISEKIYGSTMGKDIHDIIIALKENDVDVTKENIDKIYDTFSKLYDLKDVDNDIIAKTMEMNEKTISIDMLYKVKNYVVESGISSSNKVYESSASVELTDKEIKEMIPEIKEILEDMGLDEEDLDIAKSILKTDLELNPQKIAEIKALQEDFEEVQNTFDKNIAAALLKSDIDISSIDIRKLLEEINNIMENVNLLGELNASKEDLDLAGQLVEAIKEINANSLLSTSLSVKSIFQSSTRNSNFYHAVFSKPAYSGSMNYSISVSMKTSLILQNIENLDFDKINVRSQNISLSYIAKEHGLFIDSEKNTTLRSLTTPIEDTAYNLLKNTIIKHYEYLRMNMRSSHINQMLREGIDPLNSDIRRLNQMIQEDISMYKNTKDTFSSLDTDSVDASVANVVLNGSGVSLKEIQKSVDIYDNKNNYIGFISKFLKNAKEHNFSEIEEILKKIEKNLDLKETTLNSNSLKENVSQIYQDLKEVEKIIASSKRTDKEVFQKELKELAENIKDTHRQSAKNEMVQIPFYMNGESNNANVYAKSKKKKKGEIDPNDMSVLIDLNTKKLGKMGFYIKVENKKMAIKISGDTKSIDKIRKSIQTLDTHLTSLGYDVDFINLISPENKAKISFVKENVRTQNSTVDFVI